MATTYEMSKTYQYRKVMKPLLERKRRARINKCLDDLKDLMGECMQKESGDPNVKLEKADILELTVNHLRQLKMQRQQQIPHIISKKSFRSGYIHAANEVSRCLATLPNVNVALGTRLMTHLGLRLNQLETVEVAQQQQQQIAINKPLNINCGNSATNLKTFSQQSPCSPNSSGYDSDTDSSHSSTHSTSTVNAPIYQQTSQGLLQMATPVWRPW